MRSSEAGLSTTTISEGLLEEARTRPHVPSSNVTRTPLTVTTLVIVLPRIFSPFSNFAWNFFVISSTTPYFLSSGQKGPMVGDPHVLGSAFLRSDRDLSALRSIMRQMATAVRTPSS